MPVHQPTPQHHGRAVGRRARRWAAAVAVPMALAVTLTPTAAPAEPSSTAVTRAPALQDGDDSELMLVMDSSGSMAEPAGGGVSKIEAAKGSLNTVIDTLPSDQELGLRVYGAQVRSKANPSACTDSQLVVPVGSDNRDVLRDAISNYRPFGETPIGYALQRAGEDLDDSERRNIILVSDGESTCQPDPCLVSRDLRADGVDLRVDVVGLNVTGSAREQLLCVAQTGGGIYYDAHDPKQLTDSLTKLTERAARPYEAIGERVDAGSGLNQAPTLKSGDWLDKITPTKNPYGGQLVYEVKRELANSTLFVSAAFRAPDGASNIDLSLSTPDGTECSSGFDSQLFTTGMLLSVGARAGQLGDEAQPVDAADPCLTSRDLVAVVSYGDTDQAVPIELRVSELPEITNLDDLDPVTETPEWDSPEAGTTEVTGGTSFGDAEELDPGGYAGTIVPGETLTYSVDVDWGEQLNAAAHVDQLTGALANAVAGDPQLHMQVFGPSRLSAGTTEASTDLASEATLGDGGGDDLGLTTGPVTYPNIGYRTGAAQAGTYTVTLFLEDNDDNASLPVPYDLGVGLAGDAVDGPAYDEQPIGTADATGETGDDGGGAAAPPSDPGASAGGDDGRISPLIPVVVGLGFIAAIVFLIRRQRPSAEPASDGYGPAPSLPSLNLAAVTHRVRNAIGRAVQRFRPEVGRGGAGRPHPARQLAPSADTPPPAAARASATWLPVQQPADRRGMVSVGEQPTPKPRPAQTRTAPSPGHDLGAPAEPKKVSASDMIQIANNEGGLGLAGPGARGFARSALIAVLDLRDHLAGRGEAEGLDEVIVPGRDLTHVMEANLSTPLPDGLTVVADLDAALDRLETEITSRHRRWREEGGFSWAMFAPLVLFTRPAPGVRDRLAAVLREGGPYVVSGVIIGDWPGATAYIKPDGTRADPATGRPLHTRVPVIGVAETRQRLGRLADAQQRRRQPHDHTVDADNALPDTPSPETVSSEPGDATPDDRPSDQPVGDTVDVVESEDADLDQYETLDPSRSITTAPRDPQTPARSARIRLGDEETAAPALGLHLFGPPQLSWRRDDGDVIAIEKLTPRQLELLCFLGLYPDGVSRSTLIATLWPDSPPDNPANGLQLATSRLRTVIAKETDHTIGNLVVVTDGWYRLDPELIAVDYWDLMDAIADCRSAATDAEREEAYRRAVDTYTGALADGNEHEWIEIPREGARRDAVDAASRLAQHLIDNGKFVAAHDLLEGVRNFDPENEDIYRDIMRLQHKLGRTSSIPRTLELLTRRLAELDLEPDPTTTALADRYRQ